MPPPALGASLSLILLLAGSAASAAESATPDGRAATTAGSVGETAGPWIARQATPADAFRPFDPPPGIASQPPLPGAGNPTSDGAATAARDGSVPRQPDSGQVVPASFQAPAPANAPSIAPVPSPATRAPADAISPPPVLEQVAKEAAPTALRASSGQNAPMPLAPPRSARTDVNSAPARIGGMSSLLTVGSSLAVVLGLFFITAWLMRRAGPRGAALLPTEVVEVLGRAPLAGRQQVHLLRFGNKLLLVCVSPDGAQTLTEITEPDEVTRLAGLCHQVRPNSTTAAFRQVFQQFHSEAGAAKYVSTSSLEDLQLANSGFKSIQGGRLEDHDV